MLKQIFVIAVLLISITLADEMHTRCMEQAWKLSRCCKLPEFEDEKQEECKDQAAKMSSNEHEGGMCFMDCIFKKNEMINDDGDLDKEKCVEVADKYLETTGEPDLKEIMDSSIETCFEKYESKKDELNTWIKEHDLKCHPAPGLLGFCIHVEVSKNCPADKWDESQECAEIKSLVEADEECKNL